MKFLVEIIIKLSEGRKQYCADKVNINMKRRRMGWISSSRSSSSLMMSSWKKWRDYEKLIVEFHWEHRVCTSIFELGSKVRRNKSFFFLLLYLFCRVVFPSDLYSWKGKLIGRPLKGYHDNPSLRCHRSSAVLCTALRRFSTRGPGNVVLPWQRRLMCYDEDTRYIYIFSILT